MSRFGRKPSMARRGEGRAVGPLELFHDLVFVFATPRSRTTWSTT